MISNSKSLEFKTKVVSYLESRGFTLTEQETSKDWISYKYKLEFQQNHTNKKIRLVIVDRMNTLLDCEELQDIELFRSISNHIYQLEKLYNKGIN